LAFFESALRRSRAARCFVRRTLAAENPDVHVEVHRRGTLTAMPLAQAFASLTRPKA
jgi:hypothetical protein